ncbi:MAG: type I glyceraldehyde-3-phosphate dehydrogenase [Chloroflexi bacterium]|nr:type I glyceraldehyde-3-phosphate dehydrogenase [Chloroflexota bacterium]
MPMRVGINGFGRIGRLALRCAVERGAPLDVVAINDPGSAEINAHLFRFDSSYGPYRGHVAARDRCIDVDGRAIRTTSFLDPREIPWRELGVELVIEATGAFTAREAARAHLEGGAKRVLITAPGKGVDLTVVVGVNEGAYDPAAHQIISAASCTTNALAPMAKVLHDAFGIAGGMMTTVHATTNDQRVLDRNHQDPRRARASAANVIPTTTGATRALGEVLPELRGRLTGISYRVPTLTVSLIDLVVRLERPATADAINAVFAAAAADGMAGVLGFSPLPLVSSDYRGDSHSCTIDGLSTAVQAETGLVRAVGWYDNEWGYACRVVDLAEYLTACEACIPQAVPSGDRFQPLGDPFVRSAGLCNRSQAKFNRLATNRCGGPPAAVLYS